MSVGTGTDVGEVVQLASVAHPGEWEIHLQTREHDNVIPIGYNVVDEEQVPVIGWAVVITSAFVSGVISSGENLKDTDERYQRVEPVFVTNGAIHTPASYANIGNISANGWLVWKLIRFSTDPRG